MDGWGGGGGEVVDDMDFYSNLVVIVIRDLFCLCLLSRSLLS